MVLTVNKATMKFYCVKMYIWSGTYSVKAVHEPPVLHVHTKGMTATHTATFSLDASAVRIYDIYNDIWLSPCAILA